MGKKRAFGLALFVAMNMAWAETNVDKLVTSAANEFMASPHAVGISIGVVHGEKVYSYHAGRLSKESMSKPDGQTLYPIASLTKTFAGLLLAQAALDNKVALDDDVRKYLGAGYDNLSYEQQPVRLYHLLNHRSGLPFVLPGARDSRSGFYADLHNVKLSALPGTRFQYSNAAAQLVGYILEDAYGQNFETLVKKRIAVPFGMRDVTITLSPERQAHLAAGYDEHGVRQPYEPDESQAAGALKASLNDMLAYARMQLAEQDAAVKLSHQPTYVSDDYSVGLNWQMLSQNGRRVIWQDGAIPGFASLLIFQPDTGTAVVLLSNELDSETLRRLRVLANTITKNLDSHSIAVP